jgi:hypothetical protein
MTSLNAETHFGRAISGCIHPDRDHLSRLMPGTETTHSEGTMEIIPRFEAETDLCAPRKIRYCSVGLGLVSP